jgi:hypothetical protein
LKKILNVASRDAIDLATAYSAVLNLTGVAMHRDVDPLRLASEAEFFGRLEYEVAKVEMFYRDRVSEMVENFYLLLQSAIEQNLVEDFRLGHAHVCVPPTV